MSVNQIFIFFSLWNIIFVLIASNFGKMLKPYVHHDKTVYKDMYSLFMYKRKYREYLLSALYFQPVAFIIGVLLIEEDCNVRCVSIAYARLG